MLKSYRRNLWIIQDKLRQFGLSCPMSHNERDWTAVTIQSVSHLPLVRHKKELWWKSPHLEAWDNSFPSPCPQQLRLAKQHQITLNDQHKISLFMIPTTTPLFWKWGQFLPPKCCNILPYDEANTAWWQVHFRWPKCIPNVQHKLHI